MKEITKEKDQRIRKTKLYKGMGKKIIEEKENMKGQQAAFDKILPGVQARCAVFLNIFSNVCR